MDALLANLHQLCDDIKPTWTEISEEFPKPSSICATKFSSEGKKEANPVLARCNKNRAPKCKTQ